MALSKYKKEAEELYNPLREKELASTKKAYQGQAQDTRKLYDTEIFEEGRAYQDQYRDNAVQKAINERQVAESMANLGLTDSGLNRTQQTAVQLSHANNKAAIDRQRQSAIDKLNFAKTQDLSTIRQNWLKDKASINQSYDNQIARTAQELYNKNLEEQTKRIKEAAKANEDSETKYKVRTAGGSSMDSGGNTVYYFYDENGKKYSYPQGVNPYTGKPITGGYTAQDIEEYGGVWNGYQPKGVKYNGENYGAVQKYQNKNGTVQIEHQGHYKTIWQTKDGSLWVWDDEVGNYVRAYDRGNGNFEYEILE